MLCFTLIPTACDLPEEIDGDEPNDAVVANDDEPELVIADEEEEEVEPANMSEDLDLAKPLNPSYTYGCCADCYADGMGYRYVPYVYSNCTQAAASFCASKGRTLVDAAWTHC